MITCFYFFFNKLHAFIEELLATTWECYFCWASGVKSLYSRVQHVYLFIFIKNNFLTSTWIHYRCTWVPNPEPRSHLPPHTISQVHPSAPAPSILYPASNLDWQFISYMKLYMFQCHSPKSSHPIPLPQSPKFCSIHLCLFCCLTYGVIINIFLNSIYMC